MTQSSSKNWISQVSGIMGGAGMLCIILGNSWTLLILGWVLFGIPILVGILSPKVKDKPQGELKFAVGPLINLNFDKINKWIRPVGIFVLILGIAGTLLPMDDDPHFSQRWTSIFLIGVGLSSLGLGLASRPLTAIGYLFWAIAGGIAVYSATLEEEQLRSARVVTLGLLLSIFGLWACYGFLFGKTKIYEDGIWTTNGLLKWEAIQNWSLQDYKGTQLLKIEIGEWKPVMAVPPSLTEPLQEFLKPKMSQTSETREDKTDE